MAAGSTSSWYEASCALNHSTDGIETTRAEMPSAGRPFTPELLTRLIARGVFIAPNDPAINFPDAYAQVIEGQISFFTTIIF